MQRTMCIAMAPLPCPCVRCPSRGPSCNPTPYTRPKQRTLYMAMMPSWRGILTRASKNPEYWIPSGLFF